jgi:Uma2 family endonuclease
MTAASDISPLDQQQHIVLDDVSWDFYEHQLEENGDRHIRVTFSDGSLEIMPPLPKHERWGSRIGRLIEAMCEERDIMMAPAGAATFRDKQKHKGLEPDECYYIAHWEAAQELEGPFDPSIHPPPDLAIEIDITRRSIAKQPVYAALGIPELWRFDGERLQVLALSRAGRYEDRSASSAFPFLPMPQFEQFLLRFDTERNDNAVTRAFREWVRSLP